MLFEADQVQSTVGASYSALISMKVNASADAESDKEDYSYNAYICCRCVASSGRT